MSTGLGFDHKPLFPSWKSSVKSFISLSLNFFMYKVDIIMQPKLVGLQ